MNAGRGTVTRAAPLARVDRRWRITVLTALLLIFAALIALAVIGYAITLGNRTIGNGNRVVECTTLQHVAPGIHLAQCDPMK